MLNLFTKYLDNQCSPEEVNQLLEHFNVQGNEMQLRSLIRKSLEKDHSSKEEEASQWNEVTADAYQQIKKHIDADPRKAVMIIPFFRRTWFKIAASVVIGTSVPAYFILKGKVPVKIAAIKTEKKFENDIKPGGDKATLTLADGSKIILDNTNNGIIAQQGSAKIIKTGDGQLAYANTDSKQTEILFNTVATPRGGQYTLVLPDGSKVWLNAVSSIHFPNAFTGKERKVEITGEAYFEVAKNPMMPFKVEVRGMEVEVLGTHFNINSYDDEATIKTTLLEGSLKVKKGNKLQLLSPGQQADLSNTGEIKLITDVDLEKTMAWKNGKFIFTDDNIQAVMRQLEKWYDINVEYQGNLTKEEFVGVVSRDVNISQILNLLEKTGAVRFEISNRKVIVK